MLTLTIISPIIQRVIYCVVYNLLVIIRHNTYLLISVVYYQYCITEDKIIIIINRTLSQLDSKRKYDYYAVTTCGFNIDIIKQPTMTQKFKLTLQLAFLNFLRVRVTFIDNVLTSTKTSQCHCKIDNLESGVTNTQTELMGGIVLGSSSYNILELKLVGGLKSRWISTNDWKNQQTKFKIHLSARFQS